MPEPNFHQRLHGFHSTRYPRLRDPQAAALAGYTARPDAPDLAIELPTGYGKTLVALLIADRALEAGWSVAYLTGNNQLADQVMDQAEGLPGLRTVKFSSQNYPPADLAAYHDAQAVGVMNYWTYFNTSPKVEAADVLIFDDAHLAEQPLAGLFAIRVDRRGLPELYERLCDVVLAHTDLYPSIELMREGGAGASLPPELLAFTHWSQIAPTAAEILGEGLPPSDARFVWPRVRANLSACGVLIGPAAIEIRPYHPPTQTLPEYGRARQRLYLSATLGTMDDLQRRLGVESVLSVLDTPAAADEVGDRILILNPGDEPPTSDKQFRFALKQAAEAGRTAWLCASHAEADEIEGLLKAQMRSTYRLRSGGDDNALERWSRDDAGHLVTAGRYDGIDLAGDLCRLVIIPSVPAASTEFERFVMAYLGDATFMRHRVGQRVTQALGRANRREGDWAMYLGLAPGFGTLLAQSAVQAAIPSDVRPTIDSALIRAGAGWQEAERSAGTFWVTRQSPDNPATAAVSGRLRPGRTRAAATSGSASDEVEAVTRLWLGDPTSAAEAASRAAVTLLAAGELEHAAFWRYVEAQAHFAEGSAAGVGWAIDALRAATDTGAATAWFVRLRRVLAELRGQQASRSEETPWIGWDGWIRESGAAGVRRSLERARAGLAGTHDQQAEALELLGRIVGVSAHRPTGQSVTDAVWSWGTRRRVERRLWEVKTGHAQEVPREWVNQSLGQIAAEHPSDRLRVVGCIVTAATSVAADARLAASDSICIVHIAAVQAIFDNLADRLADYAARWGSGTATERGAARSALESRIPRGGWLETLLAPTGGEVLRRDQAAALFA